MRISYHFFYILFFHVSVLFKSYAILWHIGILKSLLKTKTSYSIQWLLWEGKGGSYPLALEL